MKSIEEYVEQYMAIVQEAVPDEQVLAVAMLSRPGSMGAVLLRRASMAAAVVANHGGKDASGGLPLNVVVGLTATRVLAFDYKPKMTSIKLKGLAAEWTREGLQVSTATGTLATRVSFTWPNGSLIQLDSNRSVGTYNQMNDGFLAALGCAPADG